MCKKDEKTSSLLCFDIKLLYGRCAKVVPFFVLVERSNHLALRTLFADKLCKFAYFLPRFNAFFIIVNNLKY